MIKLVSPFHRKARLMRSGQRETYAILREKRDENARYIWFHASSLGEFEQGRPLMEKIKKAYPQYKILLTFFSPSGYEVRKNYTQADIVCYLPFDTPRRVGKFIGLANPCMAIFIKYEFWSNYLFALKERNIPTYVVSAIFRPGQIFFRWYGRSYRSVLTCFDRFFIQDKASERLLAQYDIKNVTVTGDTRFDRVVDVQKEARPVPLVEQFVKDEKEYKPFTLVVGSSWPEDEVFIIRYFNKHPGIKLVIAPHEIDESHLLHIQSQLQRPFIRLSEANGQNILRKDCLIIDSFGLLSSIYRYGEVAYIGGGFGKSIHNIVEAAVYGIPVIFGPAFHKFKEAKDMIGAGGGFTISGAQAFEEKMDELLADPQLLRSAGQSAGNFVFANVGATDKILRHLPL